MDAEGTAGAGAVTAPDPFDEFDNDGRRNPGLAREFKRWRFRVPTKFPRTCPGCGGDDGVDEPACRCCGTQHP